MEAAVTYKGNWWGYVLKRVLIAVITFFLISLMIFSILHFDDDQYLPFDWSWGTRTQTEYELARQKELKYLGLDGTFIEKYIRWMGGIFAGNWGESLIH